MYLDAMTTCERTINSYTYYLHKRFKLDIGVPVTGMKAGRGGSRGNRSAIFY